MMVVPNSFLSPAPLGSLLDALGVLAVLPTTAEREPAQGETSYHPPPRRQSQAHAAAAALHVQRGDLHSAGGPSSPYRNRPFSPSKR